MKKYLILIVLAVLFCTSILTAQCILGDCSNGYGKFQYKDGTIYEGEFRQGKRHGKGILNTATGEKYLGDWTNNERNGKGKFIFQRNVYLGSFVKSRMQGKGVMQYHNGDTYSGYWLNNKPEGKGQYKFSNGNLYDGNFVNGSFEGKGTMYYFDGSRYEGNWKRNKKHGHGVLVMYSGERQYSRWENGSRVDAVNKVITFNESTNTIEASSALNRDCTTGYCASGLGTYIYADGSVYKGEFEDGNPSGKGKVVYANGDQYEGQWKNHAPHGQGVITYINGRVLGAEFSQGQIVREIVPQDSKVASKPVRVVKDPDVKIWSVVVGVGKYKTMPKLNYTDDDAQRIYAFLKSPEGGSVAQNQIQLLIDENATRENIIRSLRETLLKADENDVIMFYFSGHGLQGYFLPVDYNGYNNRISYDEIIKILDASKAKHKMVFADACYSGGLLTSKSPNAKSLNIIYDNYNTTRGGTALMMSSRSEEVSLEDGSLRSGVFSHYLIKGLKGSADYNHNGLVTISELYNYVNQEVKDYTFYNQNPTISGNFDKEMPVSIVR